MSLWRREPLVIGLDPYLAALATGEAVPLPPWAPRAGAAGGIDDAWTGTLQDWLSARRGAGGGRPPGALRVLAGADLCQHWTTAAPAGVASLAELRGIAVARCCRLFGGVPGDWSVVADWSLRGPMVCAALPAALVRALQAAADRAGLRLQVESAVLDAVSALDAWLPSDGWCAWPTPTRLVLVRRQRRRVAWLQVLRREPGAGARAMVDEAHRQILRHGLRQGDSPSASAGEAAPAGLTWLGDALDGPAAGPAANGTSLALQVSTADGLPLWQRQAMGGSEARWAASLAAAG